MTLNYVSLFNVGLVRRNLYGNIKSKIKSKFCVEDQVRIGKSRGTFKKGHLPNWTEKIFTISKRTAKQHPIHKLTDDSGETLEGTIYEEELCSYQCLP